MPEQRLLITGGAGYVGSVLTQELLSRGYRVRVLDSLLHGSVPSLLSSWGEAGFEFVRADVRDQEACRAALDGVDAVVHLAAVVGDPACAREPELAREVNLDATRRLFDDASSAGVRRFVFASTCSNYGKVDGNELATEECELRPVSLYAETKVSAELEILGRGNGNGVAPCCLRLATVYGTSPRMRFDLTVNQFTRDVVLDNTLVVYGEQFWRPYIHVRDAARAVVATLDAPFDRIAGEVFNVGSTSENYRKVDIVELLRERVADATVEFVHKEEDPRDYRVSFEKIRSTLSFETSRTVPDGIDELIALLRSGLLEDTHAAVFVN